MIRKYVVSMAVCIVGITGCSMLSNDKIAASNTIKVIKEPPRETNNKPMRRQIKTGNIEVVEYNSSIISPEKEGYKEPAYADSKNASYGNRIETRVHDKASSVQDNVESRTERTIDRSIDNAIGRIFR